MATMMLPPGVMVETQQQVDQWRVHQQRVRQAGINESRAAAVGTPVQVGLSPAGPELQMFMGPTSPEMQPAHPQWGPGYQLGGAPPQAMGGHQGGAMEWQAQMQTVGGGQQFVQMGAVYTSAQAQATPWGGQPFASDAFRAPGFDGPVAYGRPVEEVPGGVLIMPGMNPFDGSTMQYGGGPGLGEPGHELPPQGVQVLGVEPRTGPEHRGHGQLVHATPFAVANKREERGMTPTVPECDGCGIVLDPLSKRCSDCKRHLCKGCQEEQGCLTCRLGPSFVTQCGKCGTRIPRGPKCSGCAKRYCEACLQDPTVKCEVCIPTGLAVSPGRGVARCLHPLPVVRDGSPPRAVLPVTQEEETEEPNEAEEELKLREVAARMAVMSLPGLQGVRAGAGGGRTDGWGYQLNGHGLSVEGRAGDGQQRSSEPGEGARARSRSAPPSPDHQRDLGVEPPAPQLVSGHPGVGAKASPTKPRSNPPYDGATYGSTLSAEERQRLFGDWARMPGSLFHDDIPPPPPPGLGAKGVPALGARPHDAGREDYAPTSGWDAPFGAPTAARRDSPLAEVGARATATMRAASRRAPLAAGRSDRRPH